MTKPIVYLNNVDETISNRLNMLKDIIKPGDPGKLKGARSFQRCRAKVWLTIVEKNDFDPSFYRLQFLFDISG